MRPPSNKPSKNTFEDVYEAVCKEIVQNYTAVEAGPVPLLETAEVAGQCFVALSKQDLLAIESNETFVSMIYFKLLDRPANARDIRAVAGRLAKRKSTREAEIEKILQSEEYAGKHINVTIK